MPILSYGLTDTAYWSGAQPAQDAAARKARETDFRGLHLEGPRKVDIEQRHSLPLLGLRRATLEEAFFLRLETRAVLAAVSHQDNSVLAAPAWENKGEEKEDFTPPEGGLPAGTSINPFDIDVRRRLPDFPWAPGSHTFRLYLFDTQSNAVTVELHADGRSAIGDASGRGPDLGVRPRPDPDSGHFFGKTTGTPALPDGKGLVLAMEKADISTRDRVCMVHGSFRLGALPAERLDPVAARSRPELPEGTVALVPLTLLVLGDEISGPYVFPLRVPARASSGDGNMVEGHFHVNLFRLPPGLGIPQRYVVRALHGQAESEPLLFRLRKPEGAR